MFRHIVVPLDGSLRAEAALPAAAVLAGACGATVTLLHVLERRPPATIHGERHLTAAGEAETYLADKARQAFPSPIVVRCHVHTEPVTDVVQAIVEHQAELAPDLIVMCTHGWSGVRRMLFGSIAQQVVARGRIPILLLRPDTPGPTEPFVVHRLLVPLDGAAEHEVGLALAAPLAIACQARMHLLFVVPTVGTLSARQAAPGRLLPGATREILELSCAHAARYVEARLLAIRAQAGPDTTGAVQRGDPAQVVAQVAAQELSDLIVLGTHGRAGTRAFWQGSTAARILRLSRRPVLLVPIPAGNPH